MPRGSSSATSRSDVDGHAGDVDRYHRSRARCHRTKDDLGRHVERPTIDVDEHRSRTSVYDDLGGRRERPRRHDHLVPGPHTEGFECEVERRRRRVQRDSMAGPHRLRKTLFELLRPRAGREPAGVEDLEDGMLLALGDGGPSERKKRLGRRIGQGIGPLAVNVGPIEASRYQSMVRAMPSASDVRGP